MRRTRIALGATIALASFLALSCNNSYGIFQDVQGQTKQDGSSEFKKTTVLTAFRLGANYYTSTSRLYTRNVDSTSWSQVSVAGSSSYFLRSAVVVGATMYVLVGDVSSNVALYSSPDGVSWSQITSIPAGMVLDTLFSANNCLFAVSHTYVATTSTTTGTSYYDLYYFTGSAFSPVSGFTGLTDTIRGVVSDGSNYWFATKTKINSANNPTNSAGSASIGDPPHDIWYISYTGGHLYISLMNGNLYRDGFGEMDDVTSNPLTVVVEVPSPSGPIILVGTDTDDVNNAADGYYEGTFGALDKGNDNAIVAHSSSIYNTTVYYFPVHCFYYDAAAGDLFVCISPGSSSSNYYGLYKSHWDGSSWDGWKAE